MFGKRLGFQKSCYKCFLFSDHFVLDISHFQFYLLNSFQFCTFSVHTVQRILMYQNFIQISNNKIKYIIVTDDITAKKKKRLVFFQFITLIPKMMNKIYKIIKAFISRQIEYTSKCEKNENFNIYF